MPSESFLRQMVLTFLFALLAGCGGGGGGGADRPETFSLTIQAAGLAAGDSVTLSGGGATVSFERDGSAILLSAASGTAYNVTIADQSLSTRCSVADPTGNLNGNTTIAVDCAPAPRFSVAGTVSGLEDGQTLILSLGDTAQQVSGNGVFAFDDALFDTQDIALTTAQVPTFLRCSSEGVPPRIEGTDVDGIDVQCVSKVLAPALVADVEVSFTDNSADITNIVAFQGGALFGGGQDTELWFSDGTTSGSREVLDIDPDGDSDPLNFLAVGDRAFFIAEVAKREYRLWQTDGSASGTSEVSAVPADSVTRLRHLGDEVLFVAADPAGGQEIYISDGTEAGTRMLRNILDSDFGSPVGTAFEGAVLNDRLCFAARDTVNGPMELWVTDGSEAGTIQATDLVATFGLQNTELTRFTVFAGAVYFWLDAFDGTGSRVNGLWRSDCTGSGAELVADYASVSRPGRILGADADRLYFAAPKADGGQGLFVADGTAIAEINVAATAPLLFSSLVPTANGTLFLVADGLGAARIWVTAGTTATTQPVVTLPESTLFVALPWALNDAYVYVLGEALWVIDAGTPRQLAPELPAGERFRVIGFHGNDGPIGARLFFQANTTSFGTELWVTDGTNAGTRIAANSVPEVATGNGAASILTDTADGLYFLAERDISGVDLWRTDGTTAGTVLQRTIAEPDDSVSGLRLAEDHLLYSLDLAAGPEVFAAPLAGGAAVPLASGWLGGSIAGDGPWLLPIVSPQLGRTEPWLSDLTTAGTTRMSALATSEQVRMTPWAGQLGDRFLFSGLLASATTNDPDLFQFDSDSGVLSSIEVPEPGCTDSDGTFAKVNGLGLFIAIADNGSRSELWRTDGTESGSFVLASPEPGPAGFSGPDCPSSNGSFAIFSNPGEQGTEPWVTDGTIEGTRLLRDVVPRPESNAFPLFSYSSFPSGIGFAGSFGFFLTRSDAQPELTPRLWRTDGTPEGTLEVPLSGLRISESGAYLLDDDLLYFLAEDSAGDRRLYVSDMTTTTKIVDERFRARWNATLYRTVSSGDGAIYVIGDLGLSGMELHRLLPR